MPSVVFFPWLRISEPVTYGSLRLLPYEPEGNWSADLTRVLGAYKQGARSSLEHATLIEIGGCVEPEVGELEQVISDNYFCGLQE